MTKSLDTFARPWLNTGCWNCRCEFIDRRENVGTGNSGTGKTHIGLALGLGLSSNTLHNSGGTNELLEARDERRLLRCPQLAKQDLLIVDRTAYVPLSKTGAELLFEVFSQRYDAPLVTAV